MFFGTHNCLSYSGLKRWWLYPFYFVGRCQKVSIEEQYEKYGSRFFDIRILATKKETMESAHGLLVFKKDVDDALAYLNKKGDCYVRIVLEQNHKKSDQKLRDDIFVKKCKTIESKYKLIKFTGGVRKYDKKLLYDFGNAEPKTAELYSSVTSLFRSKSVFLRIVDDWFPWFYAKLNNKKNIAKLKESDEYDCLMVDFIEIQ
jgi:hypothetical protein